MRKKRRKIMIQQKMMANLNPSFIAGEDLLGGGVKKKKNRINARIKQKIKLTNAILSAVVCSLNPYLQLKICPKIIFIL
jgi:hypothetical protein